jgi:hypothetical protein
VTSKEGHELSTALAMATLSRGKQSLGKSSKRSREPIGGSFGECLVFESSSSLKNQQLTPAVESPSPPYSIEKHREFPRFSIQPICESIRSDRHARVDAVSTLTFVKRGSTTSVVIGHKRLACGFRTAWSPRRQAALTRCGRQLEPPVVRAIDPPRHKRPRPPECGVMAADNPPDRPKSGDFAQRCNHPWEECPV